MLKQETENVNMLNSSVQTNYKKKDKKVKDTNDLKFKTKFDLPS